MSDELLFGAMDLAGGYKSIEEVGVDLGKKAAVSVVSGALGAVSFGGGTAAAGATATAGTFVEQGVSGLIKEAVGDGFKNVLAQTALAGASALTTSAVTSAINGIYWDGESIDWSREAFDAGFNDGLRGAAVSMTSTLTGGLLGQVNLGNGGIKANAFNSAQLGDMRKLNATLGSLAGQGVNYALGGDFTLNIVNLAGITNNERANMGLFEVRFGHDGVSTAIGTGGADASLGAIGAALKGGLNWGVSGLSNAAARRDGVGNAATALRSQWGFGDENAKDQLFDILFGETRMERGVTEGSAETVRDEDGKRVVELNGYKDEMTLEEQLLLGVNLQHEAYRDGYKPSMVDAQGNVVTLESNTLETRGAVLAHTEMALRMANDQRYKETMLGLIDGNENLRKDLNAYFVTKMLGDESIFNAYVDNNYDSSADYWLLTYDGQLLNDGYARVVTESGNVVVSLEDLGMTEDQQFDYTTSLAKMFGISNAQAVELMDSNIRGIRLGNNNEDRNVNALGIKDYTNALKYNLNQRRTDYFSEMTANEKMEYLKQEVILQSAMGGESAGTIAAMLRDTLYIPAIEDIYFNKMNTLSSLFAIDNDFTNENLRDFLNLNELGTMEYDLSKLRAEDGWEINSLDIYHQDDTFKEGTIVKWNNIKDGRELVFGRKEDESPLIPVTNNQFRETYNYAMGNFGNAGTHLPFDMVPYFEQDVKESPGWYKLYRLLPIK